MGDGGDNSISTVTWFRGDYRQAEKCIQERMKEIRKANPWLRGRIVQRTGSFVLVYDSSCQDIGSHYECRENEISRDLALDQLGAALSHLLLKNGPDQPLWKVSILPCRNNPSKHFALVCSISHIIADGFTYYKVLNMLTFAEPVTTLDAKRIAGTEEQQIEAMGGKSEYSILQSAGFILCMVRGVFKSMLVGPKPTTCMYPVKQSGIKDAKQEGVEHDGVAFVSANYILTSWFLSNSCCRYGMMAINFRGRLDGHSNQHSRNYENVLVYQRADSAAPGLIRKSLQRLRRAITNEEKLPSTFEMATRGSFAMATNWSSFSKPAGSFKGAGGGVHEEALSPCTMWHPCSHRPWQSC